MNERLKERLVGVSILVMVAVIFIPMVLDGPNDTGKMTETNIPERPDQAFSSKLMPISEITQPDVVEEKEAPEDIAIEDYAAPPENVMAITGPVTKKTGKDKQVGLTAWVVQLGSFSSEVNADQLNLDLRKSGFPAFVEPLTKNGETVYRVRVGPELLRADVDKLLGEIKSKMKLEGIVLSYP